ncbi:DUF2155 domain-containing protein [Labrys wisconsinensis]|uniref:DUF2155 domain-containing protein n=1 Tax=Labrys wisconsinensis TaxID=425677 RepID=A0ABU0J543_9HYPH|nr:DUF2155 domain-containing protein [Labrys wisconsinensis]MDQ0469386.1 hypothetical protein [Labrys wisconsinensis]
MQLLRRILVPGLSVLAVAALAAPAHAERIKNPVAVFSGLDKISGKIISFDVAIDETVQFGALQVTPRVCYSRSATENPQTTSFIEVDEITLQKQTKRIFTGWMFADSPGLHAVEHPVYDVWLTDCKGGKPTEEVPTPVAADTKKPAKPRKGQAQPAPADQPAPDMGEPGDLFNAPADPNAPVD